MAGRRKLMGARCRRQARSVRHTHPKPNANPNPNPITLALTLTLTLTRRPRPSWRRRWESALTPSSQRAAGSDAVATRWRRGGDAVGTR